MRIRRFTDATSEQRCKWTIRLHDSSEAQCGRKHVDGLLCTQHAKILESIKFDCCGGNDELPPGHCADCCTLIEQQAKPAAVKQ